MAVRVWVLGACTRDVWGVAGRFWNWMCGSGYEFVDCDGLRVFVAGGAEGRFESSVRVAEVLVDEFLLWCVGFVGV